MSKAIRKVWVDEARRIRSEARRIIRRRPDLTEEQKAAVLAAMTADRES